MMRYPSRALLAGLICAAVAACTTASPGGGGGGGAILTSGGAVGSTCPKQDQIGCAPDLKHKVRCTNGVWVSDGACGNGESCVETKPGSDVVATQCVVPTTSRLDRATMCAKASACLSGSFSSCMNPPPLATMQKMAQAMGMVEPKQLLYYGIDAYASCIRAAKDCEGVRACVKSGTSDCSNDLETCSGTKLSYCEGSTSVALDCAQVGLPCFGVTDGGKSMAVCGRFSSCSAPKTISCAGSTAKACEKVSSNLNMAVEMDCGLLGGTCDPAAPFDDDPDVCKLPGGETCDAATYVSSCQGNFYTHCNKGKTSKLDCSLIGMACVSKTDGAGKVISAGCKVPGSCDGSQAPDTTNLLTFCEGGKYVSFDCALAGMVFNGAECAFATAP